MKSVKDFKYHNVTHISDKIALVEMNAPADNSLTIEFMNEMAKIHDEMEKDPAIKGIILTSAFSGFFSNGLKVSDLLNSDTKEKTRIFETLYDLSFSLYKFSKVHVSLINGHAMAGGAILSAMSDFRFLVDGPFRISFSEVKLGIIVPEVFLNIISDLVGPHNLNQAVLLAKAYKTNEALENHLVSDIFNEKEALKKTISFLKNILSSPPESLKEAKLLIRKKNLDNFIKLREETIKYFSNFFNDNFQEALLAIKEKRRPVFKY